VVVVEAVLLAELAEALEAVLLAEVAEALVAVLLPVALLVLFLQLPARSLRQAQLLRLRRGCAQAQRQRSRGRRDSDSLHFNPPPEVVRRF